MPASWSCVGKPSNAGRQARLCRGTETRMRTAVMARSAFPPDLRYSGGLWRRAARLGAPDLDLNVVLSQVRMSQSNEAPRKSYQRRI